MKYRDATISILEKAGYSLEEMREMNEVWLDYLFLSRYRSRDKEEEQRLEEVEGILTTNGFNLEGNLRVPAPENQNEL